jgi:hypothetical protein
MEKFLLLVREDLAKLALDSKQQRDDDTREMILWAEELAGSENYISGEALEISGKYVNRELVMSDGPFIEAKEGVSGFIMIKAENINQAVSIAQTCPLVLTDKVVLEIRPIREC